MSSYATGKGTMRGLTLFISNVRQCRGPDEEEKLVKKEMAKIRKKLHEQKKSLDGYNRRKHIAKLLFMYLLGYEADFAYKDTLRLCMSPKFPEKLIGYVTLGVVIHHEHALLPEVLPCLKSDLVSGSEPFICLALAAAANIGGEKMVDLVPTVKALISSSNGPLVTKKALLCMLRLRRVNPSSVGDDWVPIFTRLLSTNNNNVGVIMATLSLLNEMALHSPATYQGLYDDVFPNAIVVGIFTRVITGKRYESEYLYYSVPCPWLQISILKFLQNYPAPPTSSAETVLNILTKIIQSANTVSQEAPNQKNAFYAILFECVSLVIVLKNSDLMSMTAKVLGSFLQDRTAKPNHVYNGLQAMTRLARLHSSAGRIIKQHQAIIVSNLGADDVSIRRLCLDLVYGMCDKKSSGTIVAELLSFLQKSIQDSTFTDLSARDELVLKISILAERYSLSYRWYVDVMLKLITLAGDHMNDHVWYRTIKIITNQEDLQEYATQTLFVALQNPASNQTVIKIACYILGEYGDMIANQPKILFQVVHSKFVTLSDDRAKAIILSTYIKFLNLFPALSSSITSVFDQYRSYVDPEIQQRSCEYLALSQLGNKDMLANICEIMPAYEDFKADGNDEFADSSSDEDVPIVFTPVELPPDQPATSIRDPEWDAKQKMKQHQRDLEDAAQLAAEQLQNDFADKQKRLAEQENSLRQAELELQEKERQAKKKLEKMEKRDKQKQEEALRKREEQLRTKKEEIAQHFQTQAQQAQQQLQQQALEAQQQQVAVLREQQRLAELELQAAAARVVAQQEAEIQARKQQAERELQTQLLAAKQAHEAAISQQGARAQMLLEKEQELASMQNKIQQDFQAKQEEINREAERQQAQLAAEAQRLKEQEQRIRAAEQKEKELAAREAQLLQQQALLVQKAQQAQEQMARQAQQAQEQMARQAQQAQEQMMAQKRQMEEEARREKEQIAAQQALHQQEQARLVALAEQERQRLAAAAATEQEKIRQQQAYLQQQAQQAAQALEQEKQRAMALAAAAEREKQEAERQKAAAQQQQAQAALQAQQANALSLAQQQASAMASALEQSRLKAAQANSAEKQAEMARKLSVMQEGVMMEESTLQIGMKSQYQTGKGRMAIYFTNKTQAPFTQLQVTLPPVPYLTYQLQPPQPSLGPGQQTSCVLVFSCDAPFETYPEMAITFSVSGLTQSSKIKLPITITRFCDPLSLDVPTFFTRWTQINGPPQEITESFTSVSAPAPEHIAGLFTSGFRWAIIPGADPNPCNMVGAATFHSSRGSVYCYMRIETNQQANAIRLTLKSGSAEITNAMKNVFLAHLSKDHQPKPTPATSTPPPATQANPFATNSALSQPVPQAPIINPFATNSPKPANVSNVSSPFLTNSLATQIAIQSSPPFGQYTGPVVPSTPANPFATATGQRPASSFGSPGPQAQSVAQILSSNPYSPNPPSPY